MNDITLEINNEDEIQILYIGLPEPEVLENHVVFGEITTSKEHDGFFNSIDSEKYQGLISEIEQEGLQHAEENGIYKLAERNAKTVIEDVLSGLNCQVVFL